MPVKNPKHTHWLEFQPIAMHKQLSSIIYSWELEKNSHKHDLSQVKWPVGHSLSSIFHPIVPSIEVNLIVICMCFLLQPLDRSCISSLANRSRCHRLLTSPIHELDWWFSGLPALWHVIHVTAPSNCMEFIMTSVQDRGVRLAWSSVSVDKVMTGRPWRCSGSH